MRDDQREGVRDWYEDRKDEQVDEPAGGHHTAEVTVSATHPDGHGTLLLGDGIRDLLDPRMTA